MDSNKAEDPRARSAKYVRGSSMKYEDSLTKNLFDFGRVQFVIDDNYIGEPPNVQVSIENLNDNIDENFLKKDLTKLGKIRTLEILRHPKTKQHLGLAKIQFEDVSVAQACVDNFNGKHIMGRQLHVFKDLRFAMIEEKKEAKLNPKPLPHSQQPTALQPIIAQQQQANAVSAPQLNVAANAAVAVVQPPGTATTPQLASISASSTSSSSLPITPALVPTPNSIGFPPLPPQANLHPSQQQQKQHQHSSITLAPHHQHHHHHHHQQRLEDRIAIMMKQQNCPLSSIVAPIPQASPTYSAFSLSETVYEYTNSSYYHSQVNMPLKALDKQRPELNDYRRLIDSNNSYHNNHYQNYMDPYANRYDKMNNKSERYSDHNSDDDWNKLPEPVKQPLDLNLTEEQISNDILPFCYKEFFEELGKNLLTTSLKKLRETYGYQSIEKAQTEYKNKRDRQKVQEDRERIARELEKQMERRYMTNKARVERQTEAPRPRVNLIRQRTGDYNMIQDNKRSGESDLRRVNRSSAYVAEPERRGSHNTSIDSDYSDSDSSSSLSRSSSSASSSSSSASSSSSRSSSPSGSSSSSRSSSRSSSVSSSSHSSDDSQAMSIDQVRISRKDARSKAKVKIEVTKTTVSSRAEITGETFGASNSGFKNDDIDRQIAVDALLEMAGEVGDSNHATSRNNLSSRERDIEDEEEKGAASRKKKVVKRPPKTVGRKRKKDTKVLGVASEYRAAKRFASDPSIGSYDENIENAMIEDENLLEVKQDSRFMYPERSKEEKQKMLDDLYGTLSEEDIKFLYQVHESDGLNSKNRPDEEVVLIPFGSENANRAHLNMRKHMIEGKVADSHPKWWRGCSRCDVIEVSEKEKMETEEMNYEDLTKAPIKSHVIQVANSSRRDLRGDQRRIAVLNPNIDAELIKMYTTSTLQMRAKNLRFSRSKIHKWGLFACEKIASGDAVIEYVGEKIRPSLADHREKVVYTNLPTHDGSSYFFRVDYDVIDATLKGNKARFINHSCNPNCFAKVIKHDNGSNSIVIYAKQFIAEEEEITYDYKFPREETDQKIRCNCKAPNCQKFLN